MQIHLQKKQNNNNIRGKHTQNVNVDIEQRSEYRI